MTHPLPGTIPRTRRSAIDMVNACFRHQHPEAFGRDEVPEPPIPAVLREGPGASVSASPPQIAEEPMGHPDARPLPD